MRKISAPLFSIHLSMFLSVYPSISVSLWLARLGSFQWLFCAVCYVGLEWERSAQLESVEALGCTSIRLLQREIKADVATKITRGDVDVLSLRLARRLEWLKRCSGPKCVQFDVVEPSRTRNNVSQTRTFTRRRRWQSHCEGHKASATRTPDAISRATRTASSQQPAARRDMASRFTGQIGEMFEMFEIFEIFELAREPSKLLS